MKERLLQEYGQQRFPRVGFISIFQHVIISISNGGGLQSHRPPENRVATLKQQEYAGK